MSKGEYIGEASVSIIVKSGLEPDFFRACIATVLAQTFVAWEMICLDDGRSPAATDEITVAMASDTRIHRCGQETGSGWQAGLNTARGKYVILVDGTVGLESDLLARMIPQMEEKRLDMAVCRIRSMDGNGVLQVRNDTIRGDLPVRQDGLCTWKDMADRALAMFMPWTGDKLYRREILLNGALPVRDGVNDTLMAACAALLNAERIAVVEENLCYHQRLAVNALNCEKIQKWHESLKDLCVLWQDIQYAGYADLLRVTWHNFALHQLTWYLSKTKEKVDTWALLVQECQNGLLVALGLEHLREEEVRSKAEWKMYDEVTSKSVVEILLNRQHTLEKQLAEQEEETRWQLDQARIRQKEALKALQRSGSYRIGRILTSLPRRIRDLFVRQPNILVVKTGPGRLVIPESMQKINDVKILSELAQWQADYDSQLQRTAALRRKASVRRAVLACESYHAFIVNSMIVLCDYKKCYVEAYVTEKMYAELVEYLGKDVKYIHWFIVHEYVDERRRFNVGVVQFVTGLISRRTDLDQAVIVSPEYNYRKYTPVLYHHPVDCEVIAMIHNINRIFRDTAPEGVEMRRAVSAASSYAVLTELLKNEIVDCHLTKKPVRVMPILFRGTKERKLHQEGERFRFVVTGNVEASRKRYDLVVEIFRKLKPQYEQLELVLLGKASTPYGRSIVAQLEEMAMDGLRVTTYDTFVPTAEFSACMNQCDYMLGFINIEYDDAGMKETYNRTKMTGTVTDMVEYARPVVVPAELAMPDNLKSSTLTYKNENELHSLLISLLDTKKCRRLNEEALKNSAKYNAAAYCLIE